MRNSATGKVMTVQWECPACTSGGHFVLNFSDVAPCGDLLPENFPINTEVDMQIGYIDDLGSFYRYYNSYTYSESPHRELMVYVDCYKDGSKVEFGAFYPWIPNPDCAFHAITCSGIKPVSNLLTEETCSVWDNRPMYSRARCKDGTMIWEYVE